MPYSVLLFIVTALVLAGCSGGASDGSRTPGPAQVVQPEPIDEFVVGKPLVRTGIGDVERVFARYESTRAEVIAHYQSQPWFQDGLDRGEELFVERGLTFVARYDGPRFARISDEIIRDKRYLYDRVQLSQGELELLLIYEPGQPAERQMTLMKQILPALEAVMGIPYPEQVMTIVNGDFDINDFNDGEFIRIDRCCVVAPFILAHELAHTYWSVAASWFNEGMADLYAVMVVEALNEEAPPGWTYIAQDLDAYYASRKQQSLRYPFKPLTERLASEGLYEAADAFLYEVRSILGPETFSEAARRVYLTSDYGRVRVSDFRVQEILLSFAEKASREQIEAMFNESIWNDDGERYRQLKELESTP